MPKKDPIIRLLLVEDSAEEAEQVVSLLRTAGVPVRAQRADSRDALAAALAAQDVDLLLADARSRIATPADAVQLVEQASRDCPVIALVAALDDQAAMQALQDRVRALALRGAPDHLAAVVRREVEDLGCRRALRRLDAAL